MVYQTITLERERNQFFLSYIAILKSDFDLRESSGKLADIYEVSKHLVVISSEDGPPSKKMIGVFHDIPEMMSELEELYPEAQLIYKA